MTNVGTELDWTRFFWDLDNAEGLAMGNIYQIYVDASPDGWDWSSSIGDTTDDPQPRMELSADVNGFGTEWDNQETVNGVGR